MTETKVYFEKQGADRLCGVHCLNSLLQGPVFTQTDLNKFAAELDKEESALLAAEQKQPQPRSMTIASLANRPQSHNVDDSGNFSLGVLEKALGSKYNLTVQNAARRDILQSISRDGFEAHDGFVIHLRDHWFSARAIPNPNYPGVREWYFLDSLKNGPQPVSENDLWGTIQGLIQSGSNVFVITGGRLPLPISAPGAQRPPVLRAHQYYLTREEIKKRLSTPDSDGGQSSPTNFTVVDPKKQKIETDWSKLGQGQSLTNGPSDPVDDDIQAALVASMGGEILEPKPEPPPTDSPRTITQLIVRFPNGTRQVRKFNLVSSAIGDVFQWLEYVAAKSISPPILLSSKSQYGLVGTMDKRGTKILKQNQVFVFTSEQGVDPSPIPSGQSASLETLGIQAGQEAFNLHF
jgi:ataxin-3